MVQIMHRGRISAKEDCAQAAFTFIINNVTTHEYFSRLTCFLALKLVIPLLFTVTGLFTVTHLLLSK